MNYYAEELFIKLMLYNLAIVLIVFLIALVYSHKNGDIYYMPKFFLKEIFTSFVTLFIVYKLFLSFENDILYIDRLFRSHLGVFSTFIVFAMLKFISSLDNLRALHMRMKFK